MSLFLGTDAVPPSARKAGTPPRAGWPMPIGEGCR